MTSPVASIAILASVRPPPTYSVPNAISRANASKWSQDGQKEAKSEHFTLNHAVKFLPLYPGRKCGMTRVLRSTVTPGITDKRVRSGRSGKVNGSVPQYNRVVFASLSGERKDAPVTAVDRSLKAFVAAADLLQF